MVIRLSSEGFLPKELPPCFASDKFAHAVEAMDRLPDTRQWTAPAAMNLARAGSVRRRLSIPNPFSHYSLAAEIETNWEVLSAHLGRSSLSFSRPVSLRRKGRPAAVRHGFSDHKYERIDRMRYGQYRLKTDIASFYPSVYTHAIEWALEGKDAAKQRIRTKRTSRRPSLGADLDELVRACQDGQTVGIPIGPDSSLILAELVLCGLDVELEQDYPGIADRGWRWFDDLEVFTDSLGEAESILARWQALLDNYELTIAAEKTIIEQGPFSLEPRWRSRLAQAPLRLESDRTAENDLVALYSEAFEIKREDPNSRALAYVAGRTSRQLYGVDIGQRTARTLLNLMMTSARLEPSTLPVVYRNLSHARQLMTTSDFDALAQSMNDLICDHARKDHGSETTWALYVCLKFSLGISATSAEEVAKVRDPFTLVLLGACVKAGLLLHGNYLDPVIARADAEGAWKSSDWILALEMARMGFSTGSSLQGIPGWEDLLRDDIGFLWLDVPEEIEAGGDIRDVPEAEGDDEADKSPPGVSVADDEQDIRDEYL